MALRREIVVDLDAENPVVPQRLSFQAQQVVGIMPWEARWRNEAQDFLRHFAANWYLVVRERVAHHVTLAVHRDRARRVRIINLSLLDGPAQNVRVEDFGLKQRR